MKKSIIPANREKTGISHTASINQSGGVTAGVINVDVEPATIVTSQKKKSTLGRIWRWTKSLFNLTNILIAFFASVVAILAYFNINFSGAKPDSQATINQEQQVSGDNVTSINQSGGITAHTVNINQQPGPRHLNPGDKSFIDSVVRDKRPKAFGLSVSGPQESLDFANEIINYMKSKGYPVESSIRDYSMMLMPQKFGTTIVDPDKDGVAMVVIGLPQ